MNITITDNAIKRFKQNLEKKPDAVGLRISIKATGCNGYSYILDYASEVNQTDELCKVSDISILVDQESLPYIKGTEIDFIDEGFNQVFRFKNPNATGECGCGESFSIWILSCATFMTIEQTLSIIKPDGVRKKIIGEIQKRFEDAGLTIIKEKMLQLSIDDAKSFYGIHKGKPFFNELLTYITSGPVMVQVLEGENAIELNRQLMGATNPQDAEEGTIRRDFASSIEENVVHGSDGPETARIEIDFFFGWLT